MFRLHLPPPGTWDDFESLCLEVWRDVWGDPAAQKNGRLGQSQAGVDIFGQIGGEGPWRGVQSRSRLAADAAITIAEVEQAALDAEAFKPPISHFTLASTVRRDSSLQTEVRKLSETRLAAGKFGVSVASWDDILDLLAPRIQVVRRLYPDFLVAAEQVSVNSSGAVVAAVYPSEDVLTQCDAIFHDPRVESSVVEELRVELRNIVSELALNAFEHGGARVFQVVLRAETLVCEDDGRAFDSITECASVRARAGLVYVREFLRKHSSVVARYERTDERNIIVFSAQKRWSAHDFAKSCTVITKARYSSGPLLTSHVEIPSGCAEYFMQVPFGFFFNASSLFEFMHHLMRRIPSDARVHVQFARGNLLAMVLRESLSSGWLDPSRVIVEESDA